MKRLIILLTALVPLSACDVGCDTKAKSERKETVTTTGGATTTTDTHVVESSGDHPPANSRGEKAE